MDSELERLSRRRDVFAKAVADVELAEEQFRREQGSGYVEPQRVSWAREELARMESMLSILKGG